VTARTECPRRFEGRVLLCTGAGSGIGEAVARRWADDGGAVALLDIDTERARGVAAELTDARAIATDVSSEESVRAAVQEARTAFGAIHCVYNAAAISIKGPLSSFQSADLWRLFAVNLMGTFLVCRESIPALRAAGGGSIVNTTSAVTSVAKLGSGAYATTKGGVLALTRHLALELAPEIRVNAVSPGPTLTAMTHDDYLALGDGVLERGQEVAGALTMLGRVATVDEIASSVCFLLSGESSYITAADLSVDGGMVVR
jgi:NAD(P)-dependent dehydrogenase (short-subunit alcohol dehydrogenase family)